MNVRSTVHRGHGGLVRSDADPQARERIQQMIASVRAAVGQIQPHELEADSTALFTATWTASRAAGFLEACALIDPALASEMFAEFASVAGMVEHLGAPGRAANTETPVLRDAIDRRRQELPPSERDHPVDRRRAGGLRRLVIRRLTPDRRSHDRRQVSDRRGW